MNQFTIKLKKYTFITISQDSFLMQPFTTENCFEFNFQSNKSKKKDEESIVLEFYQPRGGRYCYGLLGARIFSSEKGSIVKVRGNHRKAVFESSFLHGLGCAKYDLANEYLDGLSKTILNYFQINNNMNGMTIDFCYGAYDDVGSNNKIFNTLALAILNYANEGFLDISLFENI